MIPVVRSNAQSETFHVLICFLFYFLLTLFALICYTLGRFDEVQLNSARRKLPSNVLPSNLTTRVCYVCPGEPIEHHVSSAWKVVTWMVSIRKMPIPVWYTSTDIVSDSSILLLLGKSPALCRSFLFTLEDPIIAFALSGDTPAGRTPFKNACNLTFPGTTTVLLCTNQ